MPADQMCCISVQQAYSRPVQPPPFFQATDKGAVTHIAGKPIDASKRRGPVLCPGLTSSMEGSPSRATLPICELNQQVQSCGGPWKHSVGDASLACPGLKGLAPCSPPWDEQQHGLRNLGSDSRQTTAFTEALLSLACFSGNEVPPLSNCHPAAAA